MTTLTIEDLYTHLGEGEITQVRQAVLIVKGNKQNVYVVEKPDGTMDITSYGNNFKPLTNPEFDRVVKTEERRDITYINPEGLVVELHYVEHELHIKRVTKFAKGKIESEYNRPRNKARIQGICQNVAPYVDAGFGVNKLINLSDFATDELQTHHINGKESDDRPVNLVTLPTFVHSKLHKRSINRSTELLYDEEAYIGRLLMQVSKDRRDQILLNLNEFEEFCKSIGVTFEHRAKLWRARNVMVNAFDTSNNNKLHIVYEQAFAKEVAGLQIRYYLGKRRLQAIVEIEQEEQLLTMSV